MSNSCSRFSRGGVAEFGAGGMVITFFSDRRKMQRQSSFNFNCNTDGEHDGEFYVSKSHES